MTCLRVFRGPESANRLSRFTGEQHPDVLPFTPRGRSRFVANSPLTRAKALHENRRCCHCGHGSIDPVTLSDGLRDGSGQYIPGTATLVGFHCSRCHAEWPVYGE